jgi:hypothetical protein
MAKEAIEYLKKEGIPNEIVYQSKGKRIWLSDILDEYASLKLKPNTNQTQHT